MLAIKFTLLFTLIEIPFLRYQKKRKNKFSDPIITIIILLVNIL
jgi:hypothetical protein